MAGQDANLLRLDLKDRHVGPQSEHSLRGGVQREASARRLVTPTAARGSIALTTTRLLISSRRVTCAALAKAAATSALSP